MIDLHQLRGERAACVEVTFLRGGVTKMRNEPTPALDQRPRETVEDDRLIAAVQCLDSSEPGFQPAPRSVPERYGQDPLYA